MSVASAREEGGFVLALVVFMLFAISVAGAAGYMVVNTEFSMSRHAGQGDEALTVARGGLHRFVAEHLGGVVGDSVSYAIGEGIALITTRKVLEIDSLNHLYYVQSEGTLTDIQTPGTPARRVVGGYAYHRKRPLRHLATVVAATDGVWARNPGATIDGYDHSAASDCPGGGQPAIPGAATYYSYGGLSGGVMQGSPTGLSYGASYSAMYDSIGLRWDVLTDPNFPIEFDGVLPNWASIASDSFPVVRVSGYFNPGSSWSGRGLLIVDGQLDAASGFVWNGIVLSGSADDIHEGHIRGMLVTGLDGTNPYLNVYFQSGGDVEYYSCYVFGANESLSYLEMVENSEFEVS